MRAHVARDRVGGGRRRHVSSERRAQRCDDRRTGRSARRATPRRRAARRCAAPTTVRATPEAATSPRGGERRRSVVILQLQTSRRISMKEATVRCVVVAFVLAVVGCSSRHNGGPGDGSSGSGGDGGTIQPIIVSCPGCPPFPGLGSGSGTVPPCTGSAVDPALVYPPDNVLLPPNMNVIEAQFMPGSGNSIFEIDFENNVTDVRIETECNAITNTRGTPTGGCSFDLDQTEWSDIATANAGGAPLQVTVRGAPTNLSCVIGSNTRSLLFASQPLSGGIYYWQTVTQ